MYEQLLPRSHPPAFSIVDLPNPSPAPPFTSSVFYGATKQETITSLRTVDCPLVVEGRERRVGLWGIEVIAEPLVEIRENVPEGEVGGVHGGYRTGKENSSPPIIPEPSA
jgi:hypothetical protein